MFTASQNVLLMARKYRRALAALEAIANCQHDDLALYCAAVDAIAVNALVQIENME